MHYDTIKKHEKNLLGRDFVVGDLHGRLDLLNKFMEALNFDKEIDRMFCTGDLVDRGPRSLDCLRLISEPWFFATKGNHEDMLINSTCHQWAVDMLLDNGGSWFVNEFWPLIKDDEPGKFYNAVTTLSVDETSFKHDVYEIGYLLEDAMKLPLVRTIECDGFHAVLLHAELDRYPTRVDDLDSAQLELYSEHIMWARKIGKYFYQSPMANYQEIKKIEKSLAHNKMIHDNWSSNLLFVQGHTVLKRPVLYNNIFFQDTGAFLRNGYLSALNLTDGKLFKITTDTVELQTPVSF